MASMCLTSKGELSGATSIKRGGGSDLIIFGVELNLTKSARAGDTRLLLGHAVSALKLGWMLHMEANCALAMIYS
ncbi:hypothetical protein LMG27198_51710 [Methylocystis echinoides]|uniref:Uncharacterized protein n=1 Tax=Methylocystis echinoides TaxID=29468 RepID=A0A9W6GZV4_9HYPH|nr:hypothetical protein LMG27198_51710 [Methylocystis echinoides]